MTIEEKMRNHLHESGLFPDQIDAVIERVKTAPENEAMERRWNDDVSGYPPMVSTMMWHSVKRHTMEYIDETCPKAWFRPLFAE